MAFGRLERPTRSAPMGEINMTPLIDVMLVLLIIFMVTAPMMNHGVTLDLPKVAGAPLSPLPGSVHLALDAKGQAYWDGQALDDQALAQRLLAYKGRPAEALKQVPVMIRADAAVPHGRVMAVVALAREAGLSRMSFETAPSGLAKR